MSLKVKSVTAKDKNNRLQDGTYMARIVQIIDMGMQAETDWQTQEEVLDVSGQLVYKPKVLITFEFPTERITIKDEDRPRWQSKEYTVSSHEKSSLFALIQAAEPKANPKGYNLVALIDKPVMISIGSTVTGNAKVSNVASVPRGIPVPPLENEPRVFDMDEPDMDIWDTLLDWQKEKIVTSPSYKNTKLEELDNAPQHAARVGSSKKPKAVESSEDGGNNFGDDDIPF